MNKTVARLLSAVLVLSVSFCFFACNRDRKESRPNPSREREARSLPVSPDNRPVIVAFGDSLTAGAGVDPVDNYPSRLQRKIDEAGYRYRVVNAGVSGDTSGQGLSRIQGILDLRPAVVIVELGANDGLRGLPAPTTRQNLGSIVRQLQSAGAKVVLAGMRVPPNYGPQYANAFRNIYEDVARQFDIPLIPFFLEGVGGNPSLNQDDGIHPTAEGYKIVVGNVWKALRPLL